MSCRYEDICKDIDDLLETETDRETCTPDTCVRYADIDEGVHLA